MAKAYLGENDLSSRSQVDAAGRNHDETGRIIWDFEYKRMGFVASTSEEVVNLCHTKVPLLLEEEGISAPLINATWMNGLTEDHLDLLCRTFEVSKDRRYCYWILVFYQLNHSLHDDPDWNPETVDWLREEMIDVPAAPVLCLLAVARRAEKRMTLTLEDQQRALGVKNIMLSHKKVVESLSVFHRDMGGVRTIH